MCRLKTVWGMKRTSGKGECSDGKAGGRRVCVLKVYYTPALKSPSTSLCNNRKDLKIDFKKLGHLKKKHQVKQSSTAHFCFHHCLLTHQTETMRGHLPNRFHSFKIKMIRKICEQRNDPGQQ